MGRIGLSLACLGLAAILLRVLAWHAAAFLIEKCNPNPALDVPLAVPPPLPPGALISILSIFLSIPLALQ